MAKKDIIPGVIISVATAVVVAVIFNVAGNFKSSTDRKQDDRLSRLEYRTDKFDSIMASLKSTIKESNEASLAETRLQYRSIGEKLVSNNEAGEGRFSAMAGLITKLSAYVKENGDKITSIRVKAAINEAATKNNEKQIETIHEYRGYSPKSGR